MRSTTTNRNIWNQRLPSLMSILVLFVSVTTIFWLSSNAIMLGTRAATGPTPQNVQISNITDTSFTVSYATDEKVVGTITYGRTAEFGNVARDDRDVTDNAQTPYRVHSITVKNLTPQTQYLFSIVSGTQTFLDGDKPYQVITASTSTQANAPNAQTATGKVTLETGGIPLEGVVYLSSHNSELLSVLLQPDGTYTVPLGNLRTADLQKPLEIDEKTVLNLIITNGQSQSLVSLLADQANPVPEVILAQNYDFAISTNPLSPAPNASNSGTITLFPTIEEAAATGPQIVAPEKGAELKDQQPVFRGKALPNEIVDITINSEQEISAAVRADSNGNWEFRPDEPLDPGEHTVTIETPSLAGVVETVTRNFTVYAEGSSFTEPSVSPSAASQATAKPTQITPTNRPTATATPSPTVVTPTISPTAAVSITPLISAPPVTQPPVPVSGNHVVSLGIIATGLLVFIGGILFVATGGIL